MGKASLEMGLRVNDGGGGEESQPLEGNGKSIPGLGELMQGP